MTINQYVHAAKSGEEGGHFVYAIKSFVEPHLLNLIYNEFNVKSIAEYGEFLCLPTEINLNDVRKRRYALAISILRRIER